MMLRTWTFIGLLLTSAACGDDAGSGPAEEEPGGDPCPRQGHTDTGCTCEEPGSVGVRSCTADLVWTPCSCPPVGRDRPCTPGDVVACSPCAEGQEPRRGVCREDGTALCPACDGEPRDAAAAAPDAGDAG